MVKVVLFRFDSPTVILKSFLIKKKLTCIFYQVTTTAFGVKYGVNNSKSTFGSLVKVYTLYVFNSQTVISKLLIFNNY